MRDAKNTSRKNWQYRQWEERNLLPSTLRGKTILRPLQSSDTRSPGYLQTRQRIRFHTWHDVDPFSMALWPCMFAENLRNGNWWLRRENYPDITVEMVLEGGLLCEFGAEKFHLKPGDLLLTHPGDTLTLRSEEGQRSRELQLSLMGGMLPLLLESLGLRRHRVFRAGEPAEAERLLREIGDFLARRRVEEARANSRAGYDLMLFLAENVSREQPRLELPQLLVQALRSMEHCRNVRMSITELAGELGVCRTTLTRLFRRYLDVSPRNYWERLRVEIARQLLVQSKSNIKEIAAELGFTTPFYFSTVFRRLTGMSPSQFRAASEKSHDGR